MKDEEHESFMNGWAAHRQGCSVEANPYNESTENFSHSRWLAGWCGRFSAVKHDLSLELDEVCT